ncbi:MULTISPECIES: hypothetical protein [Joostella]|uniref:hypothetical protein n=1 Tax=Joostella TaxID=453850 RepID=UPI001F2F851B|nr:hypothetical protein [Joostella atrarenae]
MINLPNYLLPFIFLFLGVLPVFSQEGTVLKVFIYKDDRAVTNFGIANLTRSTEGKYEDEFHTIIASEGDQLFIASDDIKNFYKLVTTEDINNKKIEVYTKDGVIQLEEVVLTDYKLSYGKFTDNTPKTYTPAERRLAAATKYHYKGGGMSLSLDPLINAISGRTKTLKRRLRAETKNIIVGFLEDNYKDFILNDLDVPRDQMGLFCYYISEKYKAIHRTPDRRRVEQLLRRGYLDFVDDPAEE